MTNRILETLKENENVSDIQISEKNYIIKRKEGKDIYFHYLEINNITIETIKNIEGIINFLIIIPKEWQIDSETMIFLKNKNYSFGGLGDIHRYIRDNFDNNYCNDDESKFIFDRLSKNKDVKSIERIGQHIFRIYTLNNRIIDIFSIYEYDFGSYILEKYEISRTDIKFIWSRNPYAKITKDAEEYANKNGLSILRRGELLSLLN